MTSRHRKLSKWKSRRWDWLDAHLVSYMGSPGGDRPERVIVIHGPWWRRTKTPSPARTSRRHGASKQQESEEASISFLFFFSCYVPPSSTIEPVNSSGESTRATQFERGSFRGKRHFLTRELRQRLGIRCLGSVLLKGASPAEGIRSGSF